MNFIFFFVFVILSCPFLLHSAMPICPESFSCPNCVPFKYPFYDNGTDEGCGLIKVHCTSSCGEIQFGGRPYVIGKVDYGSSIIIHNSTFEQLVKTNSCVALLENFTSPDPLLYSISVAPFITLLKCTKNLSYDQEMNAYFDQHKYNHYRCQNHSFYYKYLISNTTVPRDLPYACQVIHLPVKERWEFRNTVPDETNLFSLLNSYFSISFKHCPEQCHKKGRQCLWQDGQFQCLDAKKERPRRKLILILVLAGSTFIFMLSSVIFMIWRRYKRNPFLYVLSMKKPPDLEDRSIFNGVHVFSYTKLKDATQNFDPSLKLGDGGFGAVYYGKLKDGREVAVKRFYEHNYKRFQHFMNEVEILTRLRHPNLVLLYGCTSQQSHELLLVYEYIPNGTVAHHLHGKRKNPSLLTWPIRMNIAIETASALVYLHASEIIHRDVKSNNILLDHNFCVKVADFGLSRLVPTNATHVSTSPQGTPGYLDPQYHQCYQLTDKSDVYSFGVVLIELISSMVAVDLSRSREEISLANLALNRIQRGDLDQLIDPVFRSNSDAKIIRMITSVAELAFLCLQYDSEMRPTMNEVLNVLMDIQGEERIDADENIIDFDTVKPKTSSETDDSVVLLKDFRPSPVSVNGIWQSDNSASTTVSSNGDRLPIKNHIST